MSPAARNDTKEDIEAARKAEAEKGQSSVFDSLLPTAEEDEGAKLIPTKSKTKHTHVCHRTFFQAWIPLTFASVAQVLDGKLQNLT